ncbi:uncharacterized protein LOC134854711 [Symsagittifera roscoffensis]|uniref:uncharacterized protein LOC134854711 n=1 Tax=Symsagittifera roscoffensis TaxID=84072 RepID=UPI00307C1AFF
MLPNVDTRDHSFIVIALEFVLTMEILMTNKNNEMLVYRNAMNGRVRTFQDNVTIINEHSNFPDPADIEKRKFRTALKTKAVVSDEPPRQTILSVQRDINRETAAVIPSYSANQRTINRVKQEKRPRMQEPHSLTDFELPELLKVTHSGERFLHFDSGPNDTKRIMVFTTLPGLDILSGADDWFCDGTFSTAPSVFFQIYTIHASVEGILIPIVYALLPDKKEETYFRLLSCFDIEFPERATIDFEIAVKNAFNSVSKIVQNQYCYFHLSQSVWRHIQTTGNTNNYRLDLEFREHVRMLLSIAFLPVSDVSTAFETLQKTCPETAHPIFNYFEDNYVGRLSAANGTRQNPRFEVDSWSCHQRVITGRPRTNNAVEGWNSNFVKLVNGKHPSFPKLIEKFQDEQKNAEILIEKMCAGRPDVKTEQFIFSTDDIVAETDSEELDIKNNSPKKQNMQVGHGKFKKFRFY